MARCLLLALAVAWFVPAFAFHAIVPPSIYRPAWSPSASLSKQAKRLCGMHASKQDPMAFASGYSPKLDLLEALQEATEIALKALPAPQDDVSIDLALVVVSSLYDGQSQPSVVVPAVLSSASGYGNGVQKLIGCTTGGIVASMAEFGNSRSNQDDDAVQRPACSTVESEGVPGVSVTLGLLPGVNIKTFHVLGEDVPDDLGRTSPDVFKQSVGLRGFEETPEGVESGPPAFMLIPSPAFQNDLDDFLLGIHYAFPTSTTFGGIASTVSSLSRARLFRYDASDAQCIHTLADGCVGIAMQGDLEVKTMIAQGAKPVGGVYRVVSGIDSTIGAIVLDESVDEEESESDEEERVAEDAKALAAAEYAKARIPKPVLAEANFLMKTLSDDERMYMRKALLVGLERGGCMGRSPDELIRLAEGKGHRFAVHQVASAGMKNGSVTLPLGSVNVQPGMRMRFFVRESDFARREVQALWMGYKKRSLTQSFENDDGSEQTFTPSACIFLPTLDRGSKFFGGKPGYESGTIAEFLPSLPCVTGFFSNGVIGRLDDSDAGSCEASVQGSASSYVLIGSKSGRPVFSPSRAAADEKEAVRKKAELDAAEKAMEEEDEKRRLLTSSPLQLEKRAPRDDNGELLLKRREVHSGRAISVSTVEWSVAEKTATPTSALEGFMWDKEAEVDRFRERVPLSNLVSQCRQSAMDPSSPKPRDWAGSLRVALTEGHFAIVPECKRIDPASGSLRKRFDLAKLVKQFTLAGAPAISVNCDGVLFGGSLDDLQKAREAAASASLELSDSDGIVVPPILASDLILYPYQLYKIRLSGADAVNLVAGALASKDLLYLTKIASSLQLQIVATVTTEVQIKEITDLPKGSMSALIISNRELEDFSFDMSGDQALSLLQSDALKEFRKKHGDDVPILVEGRVGIIERADESGETTALNYVRALRSAGASGAIVGGGLALDQSNDTKDPLKSLMQSC